MSSQTTSDLDLGLRLTSTMPKQKKPTTDFGVRLIALRQARGMTQIQLAAAIKSTQRAVSYYETGGGYPTPQALIALAKTLDVTSDELLGIKPVKKERTAEITAETRRFWKTFQKVAELPERDQKAVARLINSLVASRQAA
jgi:transcriptional regulator with XRE-family HTH domain